MEDDVYRAPEAPLLLPERAPDRYYVVSPTKFWVLSIATAGLYRLYWHYKNWALYRASTGERIWPVMRAIFAIFFTHALFREVDASIRRKALTHSWHPMGAATFYVIASLVENASDRMAGRSIGSPWTDLASILCVPLAISSLYVAQKAINVACDDPDGGSNRRFTIANWVWIGIGFLLWSLIAIGMLLPAEPA
jgi:MFS-type transporter involved in bile tolerance (Atg22 family)